MVLKWWVVGYSGVSTIAYILDGCDIVIYNRNIYLFSIPVSGTELLKPL